MTPTPPVTAAPPKPGRIRYLDGDKLLAARLTAGLSQPELARKMDGNVTQSLISHWERGLHSATLQNVLRLARVLGCEPRDLMPDDLLSRIEGGDLGLLKRLEARGIVIQIRTSPAARPVCSECRTPWDDGHKCQKTRGAA